MKTKLFIDTEFNGFQGELISMGIVDEDGNPFYEVLDTDITDKWVLDNVGPHLLKMPISKAKFQEKLVNYLSQYKNGFNIIADWPEDIEHFCHVLITSPGAMLNVPSFEINVVREIGSVQSSCPHNALADAIAIKLAWEKLQ